MSAFLKLFQLLIAEAKRVTMSERWELPSAQPSCGTEAVSWPQHSKNSGAWTTLSLLRRQWFHARRDKFRGSHAAAQPLHHLFGS